MLEPMLEAEESCEVAKEVDEVDEKDEFEETISCGASFSGCAPIGPLEMLLISFLLVIGRLIPLVTIAT